MKVQVMRGRGMVLPAAAVGERTAPRAVPAPRIRRRVSLARGDPFGPLMRKSLGHRDAPTPAPEPLEAQEAPMSETLAQRPVSRAQFLRNTAKGAIALSVGGSVLASVQGVALAAGVSDNSTLQAAYAAESLAVHVYTGVLANFAKFKHPALMNIGYFQAALKNEEDHKAFLGKALGAKAPTGLTLNIPASALKY